MVASSLRTKRFFLSCLVGAGLFFLGHYRPLSNTTPLPYHESIHHPHPLGIYVINLDDSTDRWRYVYPALFALGFPVHRVSGINGALLSESFVEKTVDTASNKAFFLGKAMGKGSIGCSLSHIKAWQTFLASPYRYGLICEDDIGFSPNLLQPLINAVLEKNALWDICALSLLPHRKGTPLTLDTLPSGHRLCLYLRTVLSAGAYLINRYAAKQLLSKALPIKMPLDHFYTLGFDLDLTFTGIEPRPVNQDYGRNNSDIDRLDREHQTSVAWHAWPQKWLFSLRTGIARCAHNIILYLQYTLLRKATGHQRDI